MDCNVETCPLLSGVCIASLELEMSASEALAGVDLTSLVVSLADTPGIPSTGEVEAGKVDGARVIVMTG